MKVKYERACAQADMDEASVKKIRRIFEASKQKRKRDRKRKEKYGITFNSLSALGAGLHNGEFELVSNLDNPEELLIRKEELKLLRQCLAVLSENDRRLILASFEDEKSNDSKVARELGLKRTTYISRKNRIFAELQKKFFEML